MGVSVNVYFIASIFILNYGVTISQYNYVDYLENGEYAPSYYGSNRDQETHYGSCPLFTQPADCAEIFRNGLKSTGVYTIYPKNKIVACGSLKVYCDMYTDGGGWTVIQRRGDFKRSPDYFFKTWEEYKNGFGDLEKEFWLGNDNIYALTNQKRYSVRFDLGTDDGERAYATYDTFWTENEELKYRLHITDYSGTAGNSMSYHNNASFSTKDRNNAPYPGYHDCAKLRKGGWWYSNCELANLNGLNLKGKHNVLMYNSTTWKTWKGYNESLATVEIKIRPHGFQV